jgi:threonine dehydratase
MSAHVVMQSSANPFRIKAAKAQGAKITLKEAGAPLFAEAERLVKDEKRTFIHPFEGIHTSLGASGVGLELMEDILNLDAVIVSVGGGGLISGVAAAVKEINPNCKVYGVEPVGANSMSQSILKGEPITLKKVETIADSLSPPMSLPFGLALCQKYVDEIVTVSDDLICAGMTLFQEEAKLAVEPAAGAAMAGMISPLRSRLKNKRVGLIVCGANIDSESYSSFLSRGATNIHKLIEKTEC